MEGWDLYSVLTLYNMTESWPRTSNQRFKDVFAGPVSIRAGSTRIGYIHNMDVVVLDGDQGFMIECYNIVAWCFSSDDNHTSD